ncbi:unnamed protein product [Rotaria sp. Silwood2]|nr:unnamed protein product [Rotaria sp. Silwood2]CAF2797418.1 unnamed protein product [Rotaria sp. Silwood2]CAF3906345.1 unnamed protein product [Rotaria sp. Silwood2]CAF4353631.1 unnamed protein product [Rotaria sp. Silwood2]CAF4408706.1 unnamed protein product [Rotaria sp. Silwood2]
MSEGRDRLINNNHGSQIILDSTTGKYYKIVEYDQFQGEANCQDQVPNFNQYNNLHTTALQYPDQIRYDEQCVINQQSNKTIQPSAPNQTERQQQQVNNGIKPSRVNFTHRASSDNTSTPLETEQVRAFTNEDRYDYSHQNTEIVVNKRALNDSDDFVTIRSNKARKKNHNEEQEQRTTSGLTTNDNLNKYDVPLEQLQRAVVHNLPCFFVNFRDTNGLPSVVTASEELYEHFERVKVKLSGCFSIVRYIGNQLKIGVNNKADYQILCNENNWPAEIQKKSIKITMPKFTPEQFSLVVRYIPLDFTAEQVAKEVKLSANTASNFRAIIYSYPRSTNDFRFTVSDSKEYNGLLRLGHIGIGNQMRIVTTYKPANKLTYCTKCWRLGHLRNQCKQKIQKCRICLLTYDENHNEICSKEYQCAQCHMDHYSLDSKCLAIQQYRNNLNRAVKQAVEDGVITRKSTEQQSAPTVGPPNLDTASFPSLTSAVTNSMPYRTPPWLTTTKPSVARQYTTDMTNQELYEKLCSHLDEKSKQLDSRIIKLEQEMSTKGKIINEFRQSLSKAIEVLKTLTHEIIYPITKSISRMDKKTKETVDNVTIILKTQVEALQKEINVEDRISNLNEHTDNQQQLQDLSISLT